MTFRTPAWFRSLLGFLCVGTLLGTVVLYRTQGLSASTVGLAGFALLAVLGLADALVTRVEVDEEGLTRVAGFRRQEIPRTDIDRVTWESGTGVSVHLTNGSWVKLPDVGNSQARANSLRSWLKRTASGGAAGES